MNTTVTPIVKQICYYEGHGAADAYAEYVILEGTIVFCGITPGTRSTINGEEEIILAICRQEKINPNQKKFFDLQTKAGYPSTFQSGGFEFDEITFNYIDKAISDVGWEPTECPEIVQQIFSRHINA